MPPFGLLVEKQYSQSKILIFFPINNTDFCKVKSYNPLCWTLVGRYLMLEVNTAAESECLEKQLSPDLGSSRCNVFCVFFFLIYSREVELESDYNIYALKVLSFSI